MKRGILYSLMAVSVMITSVYLSYADTDIIGTSGWYRGQQGIVQVNKADNVSFGNITGKQVGIKLKADGNIFIDGRTNPRTMTQGIMRIEHTPSITGSRPINLDIDTNNMADTRAVTVTYRATGFASLDSGHIYDVSVDTDNATGGVVHGLNVERLGLGTMTIHGIGVGAGIDPVHQHAAGEVEENATQAWRYDGSYTDTTTAFSSTSTDVTLFSNDDDYVYVGHSAIFSSIRVLMGTTASGGGIKPTFEYSTGSGTWGTFVPSDGTNGFRINGVIGWEETLTGWATNSVNSVSAYYIRIKRTQNTLQTSPIEDKIVVIRPNSYIWDKEGDLSVRSVSVNKTIGLTFANQTTSGAGNTGTLTNSPVTGNPTAWLRVTINGATKYIPAW